MATEDVQGLGTVSYPVAPWTMDGVRESGRWILEGLRVLDMTAITAGGRTTQILADYGADVIKIESPTRPDPFRHWSNVTGEVGSGDLSSPPFRVVGRNKRGIAIDLKDERGVEVMRRLVEQPTWWSRTSGAA